MREITKDMSEMQIVRLADSLNLSDKNRRVFLAVYLKKQKLLSMADEFSMSESSMKRCRANVINLAYKNLKAKISAG